MLSEAEGKEGLVDLGGEGGASEKEVLTHENIIQDEAEDEDAFGQAQLRLPAVEEHHCNSALGRLFAHITDKPAREAEPTRADGQIATRELLGSQEAETERNSSLADVDAEKDAIMMKRRGSSFRETYALLLHQPLHSQSFFVKPVWKRSVGTKGEEHQVWISG